MSRGRAQLSKRGNARLRCAFWFAGRIAVRLRESSIRDRYERYVAASPKSADQRRKAYTAIAAKMARITSAVVTTGGPYRSYFEYDLPGGSIPPPTGYTLHGEALHVRWRYGPRSERHCLGRLDARRDSAL
jgi:hypothetical protein